MIPPPKVCFSQNFHRFLVYYRQTLRLVHFLTLTLRPFWSKSLPHSWRLMFMCKPSSVAKTKFLSNSIIAIHWASSLTRPFLDHVAVQEVFSITTSISNKNKGQPCFIHQKMQIDSLETGFIWFFMMKSPCNCCTLSGISLATWCFTSASQKVLFCFLLLLHGVFLPEIVDSPNKTM